MKILTKKEQDKVIDKLCYLQSLLVYNDLLDLERKNYSDFDTANELLYDITSIVGGLNGMDKIHNNFLKNMSKKLESIGGDLDSGRGL